MKLVRQFACMRVCYVDARASRLVFGVGGSMAQDGHEPVTGSDRVLLLLALANEARLRRMVAVIADEAEFLSAHGVRSLSKVHDATPYTLRVNGVAHTVAYTPGESNTAMFGGNSNWRGPVWFPMNWLLVESLEYMHQFYGESMSTEWPAGSGVKRSLDDCATDLCSVCAGVCFGAEHVP